MVSEGGVSVWEFRAWVRYSIIYLFMFSCVLATLGYFFSTTAVNRAIRNTASLQQLCRSNNEFRLEQIRLWNQVLTFKPPSNETAADRARFAKETQAFQLYLSRVFAPRNCNKIVGEP